MADAKLEIKVGAVSFSGQGSETWLSQQFVKMLERLPKFTNVVVPEAGGDDPEASSAATKKAMSSDKHVGTLVAFLKEKKASSNQTRKFLATASWLHTKDGKDRIMTSDVTTALNSQSQGKLSNAAQCLINNVKSGFIAKDGKKQFYVTEEGRTELDK